MLHSVADGAGVPYAVWMTTPSSYDPQKAALIAEPPSGPRWVHELKLDGFGVGVVFLSTHVRSRDARIVSRRGTDYTRAYPEAAVTAPISPSSNSPET